MKSYPVSIVFILINAVCFSQSKIDTFLYVDDNRFNVMLECNDHPDDTINTRISIYRNNEKVFSDSIYCRRLYIEFKDMNGDKNHDLLVYENSGARANTTQNLFLYQEYNKTFKKVQGFNQWPNLNTTRYKTILAACILTGTVDYKFFKLNDSGDLLDLNITVTDKELDGKAYDTGLKKAKKFRSKTISIRK